VKYYGTNEKSAFYVSSRESACVRIDSCLLKVNQNFRRNNERWYNL